jgi:hypothetical protein
VLHVLNGDSTRLSLERSRVGGTFAVWADALHDGPVPGPDTAADDWRRVRARYHAHAGHTDFAGALERMRAWDAGLAAYRHHDEVVIWCEHDVFDQLLLIRHLDWFGRQDPPPAAMSLICIGEYPGMVPFMGLGQLGPEQLAGLLPARVGVTPEQLAIGLRAWLAFTGPDPLALQAVARSHTSALRFLARALTRLLEDYPSTTDGLSRTERNVLELLRDGLADIHELFRALHRIDNTFIVTDLSLLATLDELASEPAPAILLEGTDRQAGTLPHGAARLTRLGGELLEGRHDRPHLHPLDRWVGGVHLDGAEPQWRWDRDRGSIVVAG